MKQIFSRSTTPTSQQELFSTPSNQSSSKFISIYRVCLVKVATVFLGQSSVNNSHKAHAVIQNLILTRVHVRNILRGILSLILYHSLLLAGFHTFNPVQYRSLEMLYGTPSDYQYYEIPLVFRLFL